jgi:hypothetical protein
VAVLYDTNYQAEPPPDGVTTFRQFIGGLNRALNDQSYSNQDGMAYNPPRQFMVEGPFGTAVEGQPIMVSPAGGVQLSPMLVLVLLGLLAYSQLKKG